jgi:hypothetical protein
LESWRDTIHAAAAKAFSSNCATVETEVIPAASNNDEGRKKQWKDRPLGKGAASLQLAVSSN